MIAQLLHLESLSPDRDVSLYINSPGGDMTALFAVYDTMQYLGPDVSTICVGQAASAAAVLLAVGRGGQALRAPERAGADPPTPRRRPGSVDRPRAGGARRWSRCGDAWWRSSSRRTGKTGERVTADIDRDFILRGARRRRLRPRQIT